MSIPSQSCGPTPPQTRVAALDVVRGFALFGIFLMNIEGMADTLARSQGGIDLSLDGIDRQVDALIYVLVQGKFYTLFSFLFGIGFALLAERVETVVYLRRLALLGVIGLLHATLVWPGDVLLSYALVGLLLPLFREGSARWLWRFGLVFYGVALAMLVWGLWLLIGPGGAGAGDSLAEIRAATMAAQASAYGEGSFRVATGQRLWDLLVVMFGLVQIGPLLFGMFLLGMAWVKRGAIADIAGHWLDYRRMAMFGLGLGLPLMVLAAWLAPDIGDIAHWRGIAGILLAWVAQLWMCLGYFAAIVLLFHRHPSALSWLAPAGRMALTIYLLQSLISTWIFYGYGLGWFGQLPRAWQPLYVLAVFAVLVAFSHVWFAHFRHGPLEWLWRWGTYGVRPPMRRVA
ncbi:DUF418 domain-containing protein [Solilutibacter pythonis]|uniref:DUF418 domain-containing protein n=1 Tax=Solilutibacter pythonis TaxID=2483112 RepID=UPI001FE58E9C|nr:DUF418 domain-containing protein [Lysobacter pythonis]